MSVVHQMSRSIQELQEAVQGLKISLLEKEREVESLQQQLKHLPVIRVMEILHADGTKCFEVVTSRPHFNLESRRADYQYNRLSLQDEELLKMKVRGRAFERQGAHLTFSSSLSRTSSLALSFASSSPRSEKPMNLDERPRKQLRYVNLLVCSS